MSRSLISRLRRLPRAIWNELVDVAEWWSNGDRRRARLSERSDIDDPVYGYGPRSRHDDALDTERGQVSRDDAG